MNNNNEFGLSAKQNERYHFLIPFYGADVALQIIKNHVFASKGNGSWISFQDKLASIRNSNRQQEKYEDALLEEFELNEGFIYDDIIQRVSSVRADLELPHYSRSIKANSLADFLNLFIVEILYDESDGSKKKAIGYKPVFQIKPKL